MSPLTEEQINAFIERIGRVFDIPLFTEADTNRLLTTATESVKWETAIKEQLSNAGLPESLDQINTSLIPLQTLAPLFAHHNVQASSQNVTTLVNKIISSSNSNPADCIRYTAPFPRDFYVLDVVGTIRPEYLAGTWFNRKNKAFTINMEYDWVNRSGPMTGRPMGIEFFASTGDHIWNFISEVHVHRTAMKEFTRAKDGWIEAPLHWWRYLAADDPLNFVDRMVNSEGGRVIVNLNGGTGGWATFEGARNYDVSAAAARLLFKFSDPGYCARADGRV